MRRTLHVKIYWKFYMKEFIIWVMWPVSRWYIWNICQFFFSPKSLIMWAIPLLRNGSLGSCEFIDMFIWGFYNLNRKMASLSLDPLLSHRQTAAFSCPSFFPFCLTQLPLCRALSCAQFHPSVPLKVTLGSLCSSSPPGPFPVTTYIAYW